MRLDTLKRAAAFPWNEEKILWLRAEIMHACNPEAPHPGPRIAHLIDAIHAARAKRPAGLTAWLEARRLARVRKS